MRKIVIFALIFLNVVVAYASNSQAGINLTLGIPQGEFRENIDDPGFGLSLHYLWGANSTFAIGGALGFITLSSQSRYEAFSQTIPDVLVEVTTSNNIALIQLLMQVRGNLPLVKPYAQGCFGFNYLWTETRIDDFGDYEDDIADYTNWDDIALSYGGGAGIMFQVWERSRTRNGRTGEGFERVYVDFKVMYIVGGEAEYLKEGSIIIDGSDVYYEIYKSETDLMTYHAGVVFEF